MYRVIPRAGVYDSDEEALPFFIVALFQSAEKTVYTHPVYIRIRTKKKTRQEERSRRNDNDGTGEVWKPWKTFSCTGLRRYNSLNALAFLSLSLFIFIFCYFLTSVCLFC